MEFLVLLGPPGSGKGTFSRHLQDRDGFHPLSTGELIRRRMADPGSEFGRKARPYMDRGDYIPDELALSLFFSHMDARRDRQRLVLDGFPRTVPQVEVFQAWCRAAGHLLTGGVFMELDVELAVARMRDRRVCVACRCPYHLKERPPRQTGVCDHCGGRLIPREDDDAERLAQRMRRHREQVQPLRDWFHQHGILLRVDARQSPGELRRHLMQTFYPTSEDIHGEDQN